jgi:hypothetical protein
VLGHVTLVFRDCTGTQTYLRHHKYSDNWPIKFFCLKSHKKSGYKIRKSVQNIQCDKKVSVHLSFLPHYLAQSDCLAADHQGQGDTRLTLTPSVIPNSNYVIMVSDWNWLKYICVFLYCNHKVHRDFLIILYVVLRGRVHIALLRYCVTAVLHYCGIALLRYCYTAVLHYCGIALLRYCVNAVLRYCGIALLRYCVTAVLHYCGIALLRYCVIALLRYCGTALMRYLCANRSLVNWITWGG